MEAGSTRWTVNAKGFLFVSLILGNILVTTGRERNAYCGPPPQVDNAHHYPVDPNTRETNRFKLDTHLTYRCNTGYMQAMDGVAIAWCITGPKWVGPNMVCIAELASKECGTPGDINNGRRDPGNRFTYPSHVNFYCNGGFKLRGSPFRVCLPNGDWTGEVPVCEPNILAPVDCGTPGDITNGRRDPGNRFTYPSHVSFYCNGGFQLRGNPFRVCLPTGDWTGEVPVCKQIGCGRPSTLRNGYLYGHRTTVGSFYFFRCNRGFKHNGTVDSTRCLGNGQWSHPTPTCLEIDCGPPCTLTNGYLDGHRTTVGSIYFFRCNPGFKPSGNFTYTTCLGNGQWSHPTATCLGECKIPSIYKGTIQHYVKGEKVDHGTAIEPFCPKGRVLNNSTPVTCNNGTWTVIPSCVPDDRLIF